MSPSQQDTASPHNPFETGGGSKNLMCPKQGRDSICDLESELDSKFGERCGNEEELFPAFLAQKSWLQKV